jgi:hypothetical protein
MTFFAVAYVNGPISAYLASSSEEAKAKFASLDRRAAIDDADDDLGLDADLSASDMDELLREEPYPARTYPCQRFAGGVAPACA